MTGYFNAAAWRLEGRRFAKGGYPNKALAGL